MSYQCPVLLDQDYEIEGCFSVFTNVGNIVVIAEKGPRFAEFLDLAANIVDPSGNHIGFIDLEAATFEAAIKELLKMDSSLAEDAVFINEYDQLFETIIAQMRETHGTSSEM